MRKDARPHFLKAQAGMTGANFAIAETGSIVVCTNEGNADIALTVPPLQVCSIGIEKLIPRQADLTVMLRMLSRSALGPPMTQYTTHLRNRDQVQNYTSFWSITYGRSGWRPRVFGMC